MTKHITPTETAKLIRKALKESFPGVKFSVKTNKYSGGSSIDVSWIDGPNTKQVEEITNKFNGAYFCGMTDYKGYNSYMMSGESVSFGADYIFTNRTYSDNMVKNAINATFAKYKDNYESADIKKPTVEQWRSGALWNVIDPLRHSFGGQSVQSDIAENLTKRSKFVTREKSKTADSIVFTGDDGYGYNAKGKGANLSLVVSN